MSKLLQVCLVVVTIVAVNGNNYGNTLQYRGGMKHPVLPEHCYYPKHNLTIPVKEAAYPTNLEKSCIKVFCREDYVLEIRHCEYPDLGKCEIGQYNYTKPFPECCPRIQCGDRVYRTQDDI